MKNEYTFYLERHNDQERRIQILEETNLNLQNELRISIEKRGETVNHSHGVVTSELVSADPRNLDLSNQELKRLVL